LPDHKILVRRFFDEVLSQANQATIAEIVAADFVAHHPQFPQGIRGQDGLLQIVGMFHGAFPDLSYRVEALVEEGTLVAALWSATGTHRGPLLNVPPTGRAASIVGMDLFRIDGGRCAETWVNSDFLGLLQQLGVIPPLQ
jgi:steroid delta-isomerase-like uncharacterized protein